MKYTKGLLILILVIIWGGYFALAEEEPRWPSLCTGGSKNPYCAAVGKTAKNNDAHPIPLRGLLLGKIIGVVWKHKGEIVSNAGESQRLAPKNDYYYIIDNEISEPFLKLSSEVEVKEKEPYQGFVEE